jgi:hypothetical protein
MTEATALIWSGLGSASWHSLPASQLARAKSGSFATALQKIPVWSGLVRGGRARNARQHRLDTRVQVRRQCSASDPTLLPTFGCLTTVVLRFAPNLFNRWIWAKH